MKIHPNSPVLRGLPILAAIALAAAPIVPAFPVQQDGDSAAASAKDDRPLPDIPALLRDISKNQRAVEDVRTLYTCRLSEEEDHTDSDGRVKSRSLKDYDVFYIGREQVRHLLAKDGKALDADERGKEDRRFTKRFDEAKKKQAELASDPRKRAKLEEEEEAQLSDFLRAERFTNPRRGTFRGQEVIAFDFAGNSDYQPKTRTERIVQKLSGVMWVDEQSREVARLEARFTDSVKVGGGLVGAVHKGSNFVFEQERINNEVWLPSYVEVHFSARVVFVKLKENAVDRFTDYKKFRVSANLGASVPQ